MIHNLLYLVRVRLKVRKLFPEINDAFIITIKVVENLVI